MVGNFVLRRHISVAVKRNLQPENRQFTSPNEIFSRIIPILMHFDVGDKYATGVPKIKKIRGRENIPVGTWNVRTEASWET